MKIGLLLPPEEALPLASRLTLANVRVSALAFEKPLPEEVDWIVFSEALPLSSPENNAGTGHLLSEALRAGRPILACLSENAPCTPKCALLMNRFLEFASAAAISAKKAVDLLGLEPIDSTLEPLSALARECLNAYSLSFVLVYDEEEKRGILFSGKAYDEIEADTMADAITALFSA